MFQTIGLFRYDKEYNKKVAKASIFLYNEVGDVYNRLNTLIDLNGNILVSFRDELFNFKSRSLDINEVLQEYSNFYASKVYKGR